MMAEMPSRLLIEWMVYARLEPFERERIALHMGVLTALIANVNRDAKKHRTPYEAKDFMFLDDPPRRWRDETDGDWRSILAAVELWTEAQQHVTEE
jgi:hypothetical protein